jgi:hypothetical protein
MKTSLIRTALVFAYLTGLGLGAQAPQVGHVTVTPTDIKWDAAPPTLPKGIQAAVLEGNPSASGPFTMRLKIPANSKIAPHSHPAIEHVTVLSGALNIGMGDRFDETKGKQLATGTFAVMPAKANHFAWTTQETVLQLHGTGPWGITYVNSADDPSKK